MQDVRGFIAGRAKNSLSPFWESALEGPDATKTWFLQGRLRLFDTDIVIVACKSGV